MRSSSFRVSSLWFALVLAGCGGGGTGSVSGGTGDGHDAAVLGDGAGGDGAGDDAATSGDTATSGDDTGFQLDAGGGEGGACSTAVTCASAGANCGPISDGCGNVLQCGDCASGETCGGGGTPSVCGKPPCTPKTCAQLGFNCGPQGDGCGNVIDCGTCTGADTCGGSGTAGTCGHVVSCSPKTCADLGLNCGPAGDGCGGALDCGSTCPSGQTCGGGGTSGVCGAPACVPKTCASAGANCGPVADGCGNLIQCGACTSPQTCGGAGTPSVCGVPSTCTNLCLKQVVCPTAGVTTTVSGTVYAPNGVDPLPNVLVYVPNAPVQPFTAGVTCDTCGAQVSGSPLVKAVSDVHGKFTLQNVPVGTSIPLVIQTGRWRRQVTIPSVAQCVDNPLPATLTRLPKNKSEGDIPLMAFVTGSLDALECVMRKIGIDDTEFSGASGSGRMQLFTGSGSAGATIAGAQTEDQLMTTPTTLSKYDVVLFACQGSQYDKPAAQQQNLIDYANSGGRVYATHYSYVWLYNDAPFSGTATWTPDANYLSDQTGYIDQTFPKGQLLAQWLQFLGASTTLGQIPLQAIRNDFSGVVPPSQLWMTVNATVDGLGTLPVHYTFNTPVGSPATSQCGRVLYDDFHVEDAFTSGTTFPGECAGGAMTPQEKLLEFMLFDLSSCVTADVPVCSPKTCAQLGIGCGMAGDGCGGTLNCGTCPAGQTCGGGGVPSQCGAPTCTPKTCAQLGFNCGPAGDGCGGALSCGTCPTGQTCGGGGMPGVCGSLACTPTTCAKLGYNCGPAGDGCGNLLQCGTCPSGQTCGGGGTPGVCGASCTPKTCAQLGYNCGPAGDGCGNLLQCGTCAAPQTCGGGGMPNVCGGGGPA